MTKVIVFKKKTNQHQLVALGFILMAVFIPLIASNLGALLISDNGGSADSLTLANLYYQVTAWILVGFLAYWFIIIFGRGLMFWREIR